MIALVMPSNLLETTNSGKYGQLLFYSPNILGLIDRPLTIHAAVQLSVSRLECEVKHVLWTHFKSIFAISALQMNVVLLQYRIHFIFYDFKRKSLVNVLGEWLSIISSINEYFYFWIFLVRASESPSCLAHRYSKQIWKEKSWGKFH
jgi:hypothetical protein